MKLPLNKEVISAISCSSILFTSLALSHEIIITEIQSSNKNVPTPPSTKFVEDPAFTTITAEILTPIRLQEERSNRFSRGMRTHSNSYHLAEVSSDEAEGARYFEILVTTKSSASIFNSLNIESSVLNAVPTKAEPNQAKKVEPKIEPKVEPKIEPKTYLKLKYLTESNKVLIQQDNDWVEKSQHKFLKFLPITETQK